MSTRRRPLDSSPSTTSGSISDKMPPSASKAITTTTRSPFVPTTLELLLFLAYPSTLILGSLFSTLSARNVPYSALDQSHPSAFAPSYWAQKRNVFNIYFVKIGWFWTTVALCIFIFTNPTLGKPLLPAVTRRRAQAVVRWIAATLIWGGVTQWFFGPPLIDRGFRLTGGVCAALLDSEAGEQAGTLMKEGKEILTGAICKAAGGRWQGGWDISGHVFLLILGSGLLWLECLPAVLRSVEGLRDGRRVRMIDGRVATAAVIKVTEGKGEESDGQTDVTSFGVKVAVGVVTLMWWMLLMTAAYFHTWPEKFTGLVVAFSGLWLVYFLPRGVPALRDVFGMPGV